MEPDKEGLNSSGRDAAGPCYAKGPADGQKGGLENGNRWNWIESCQSKSGVLFRGSYLGFCRDFDCWGKLFVGSCQC